MGTIFSQVMTMWDKYIISLAIEIQKKKKLGEVTALQYDEKRWIGIF